MIEGLAVPIHIVSCYSDRSRILCDRWRDGVILLHNSYLTSFLQHLAAVAMVAENGHGAGLPPAEDTITALGKKLVAEQMHVIAPSRMARVLFLETVSTYEPAWREVVRRKTAHPALARSVDTFARITSDFLLHHELGHTAASDHRFDPFTRDWVEAQLAQIDLSDLTAHEGAWLREEASADIFGLNCCIVRYAEALSAERLRAYLLFLARSVTVMNVLYAFAADLHRQNVDPDHAGPNVTLELLVWTHREALMVTYLEAFPFDEETVTARATDDLLPLTFSPDLFQGLWSTAQIVAEPSEDARLFAEIVSAGFEAQSFDAVIAGVRATRDLDEEEALDTLGP